MSKAISTNTNQPAKGATAATFDLAQCAGIAQGNLAGGAGVMGNIEMTTIPPLVSCFDLARSLVGLWKLREELDAARLHFTKNSAEYHNVNRSWYALASRIDAVDDMILETPAATLQDAAAKIMMVAGCLIGDSDNDGADDLGRCLLDAFFVVVRAAGVEPESIASSQYIPVGFQPNTLVKPETVSA